MSIERARDHGRTTGLVARHPRPDGISRRVASAARDRHLGSLREQVPTGWHRPALDHPTAAVSAGSARSSDPAEPNGRRRRQVGRVLDDLPTRRRPTADVAAALGTLVALGAGTVLILSATSGSPADPPSAPATHPAPPTATSADLPAPTLTVGTADLTSEGGPAVGTAPAVVSTLNPGDPGFGWPSTTFGSPPDAG